MGRPRTAPDCRTDRVLLYVFALETGLRVSESRYTHTLLDDRAMAIENLPDFYSVEKPGPRR